MFIEDVDLSGVEQGAEVEESPEEELDNGQSDEEAGEEDEGTTQESGQEEEAEQLFEVDGVKYTADQIKEMQTKASGYDALLPDYTRKSQELAKYGGKAEQDKPAPKAEEVPYYEKEDWEPKTAKDFADAIKHARELGTQQAVAAIEAKQSEASQIRQQVDDFVEEAKKKNKDFDEKDFFQYALDHKFPTDSIEDLQAIHSSYSALQSAKKSGIETGRKAKEKRQDKVATPKASGGDSSVDFSDIHSQEGSTLDRAMAAYKRVKK